MKGVVFPTSMRKTVKSKREELQLIDKTTTTKVKEKTKTFIGNIWTCNQKRKCDCKHNHQAPEKCIGQTTRIH